MGNAVLPERDTNPQHTGIQIIDRTTVPELNELASMATTSQTTIDQASSRLNPLGLSSNAIAFDISPSELTAGRSHYEQIHDRALRSVLYAPGAFGDPTGDTPQATTSTLGDSGLAGTMARLQADWAVAKGRSPATSASIRRALRSRRSVPSASGASATARHPWTPAASGAGTSSPARRSSRRSSCSSPTSSCAASSSTC
jgi:hypothetical protein